MHSGIRSRCPTAARSVVCTRATESSGRPLDASSSARTRCRARLEWIASLPPRRIAALPLLTQRAAASTVTLGRLSKIMKMTPRGTRTWVTSSPLGRRLEVMTSPTGSGSAATSSSPFAISSSRFGFKVRRSIAAGLRPRPGAASTSRALASRISPDRSRIASAERLSQRSLAPPGAMASSRAADFARSARSRHSVRRSSASPTRLMASPSDRAARSRL